MSTIKIDETIVRATEKALETTGQHFKDLVTFHLKHKYNSSLKIVTSNPKLFHTAIAELLGEYTAKLLGILTIEILLTGGEIAIPTDFDFADMITRIRAEKIKIKTTIPS